MVMTNAERQAEFRARRKAEIDKLRNTADAGKQALAEAMLPLLLGLAAEGKKNMAAMSPGTVAKLTHDIGLVIDNHLAGRPLDHKPDRPPPCPGERVKPHVPEFIRAAQKRYSRTVASTKPPALPSMETQYQEHRQEAATLSETAQQKFERLAARETRLLREMFKAEVRKEFDRTVPDRLKELEEREKRATDEIKKYQAMRNGVKAQMSVEDYRVLLGVLHPDRAPEGMSERYAKAFNIVRKLDSYIQAVA